MVKVISLSNEAYEKLKSRKDDEMSFSDVVIELVENNKKPIDELFGILRNDKESIAAFERSYKDRRKLKLRDFKF